MRNSFNPSRTALAGKIFAIAAVAGAMFSASACSSDKTTGGTDSGAGGGSTGTGGKSSSGGSSASGGSSGSGGSAGTGASGGGGSSGACTGAPATGTNDATHCVQDDGGAITQATGKCQTDAAPVDAGPANADAGAPDYGATLYGDDGLDDDCKYHVKVSVAPICENAGVTFTVTVTNTADGKPTTGAYPYVELTLDGLPPGPNPKFVQKFTEKAGGVYDVGPVAFDKAGKWTARFHFFENCSDTPEDSPHGHIAFYINVP